MNPPGDLAEGKITFYKITILYNFRDRKQIENNQYFASSVIVVKIFLYNHYALRALRIIILYHALKKYFTSVINGCLS